MNRILPRAIQTALCLVALASPNAARSQIFFDDFDDNQIDSPPWSYWFSNYDVLIDENYGHLRIQFLPFATGGYIGAGYRHGCQIAGDFDIQVDFQLEGGTLAFPWQNGVRVGLWTDVGVVERISFGNPLVDFPSQPREAYLTDFADGVQGIVGTSDLSGKLRLVREGAWITGYSYNAALPDPWVTVHTGPATEDVAVSFGVAAWSHDYAFTGQYVQLAFDNFQVNSGVLVDTKPPAVECSTEVEIMSVRNHRLYNPGLHVKAIDNCDPAPEIEVEVYATEDDETPTGEAVHSPDAKDIAPETLRLRAERVPGSKGRVYLIVAIATDAHGYRSKACCTVAIPSKGSAVARAEARELAAKARKYFNDTGGLVPTGYFRVGDGPAIGPWQ